MMAYPAAPSAAHGFSRVLIANRGEIAVRILRTCRSRGIETVIVYSEADANSLAVSMADKAVCIGPAPAARSYLMVDAIVHVAMTTGCQAVHPGYGFLAENESFAAACQENDLVFIGPRPETIALMGDKKAAREVACRAGVPVIPGHDIDATERDERSELALADRLRYPVMLKAARGGGGRGMKVVTDPQHLPSALAAARAEARAAFGDATLYAERYIANARHIEVQVFGDAFRAATHLWERDCSVQRRHQKVVEEAPAPAIDKSELVEALDAAITLAVEVGYLGAGTVEFLFDADSRVFYFIEMNTRIQVEHPVTEAVTGLDLIGLQLDVAAGRPLPQLDPPPPTSGHAIELRITAEDPERDLLPSPGPIDRLVLPSGGGVRVDTHLFEGYTVPPFYDSLLAKLIVHAETRADAIAAAEAALAMTTIEGTPTNLSVLREILASPAFRSGGVTTNWLETQLTSRNTQTEEVGLG